MSFLLLVPRDSLEAKIGTPKTHAFDESEIVDAGVILGSNSN